MYKVMKCRIRCRELTDMTPAALAAAGVNLEPGEALAVEPGADLCSYEFQVVTTFADLEKRETQPGEQP